MSGRCKELANDLSDNHNSGSVGSVGFCSKPGQHFRFQRFGISLQPLNSSSPRNQMKADQSPTKLLPLPDFRRTLAAWQRNPERVRYVLPGKS
jgi:hypothetical protein